MTNEDVRSPETAEVGPPSESPNEDGVSSKDTGPEDGPTLIGTPPKVIWRRGFAFGHRAGDRSIAGFLLRHKGILLAAAFLLVVDVVLPWPQTIIWLVGPGPEWLNENAGFANVVLTAALVATTITYVLLSARLLSLSHVAFIPLVRAHLSLADVREGSLHLECRFDNVGQNPVQIGDIRAYPPIVFQTILAGGKRLIVEPRVYHEVSHWIFPGDHYTWRYALKDSVVVEDELTDLVLQGISYDYRGILDSRSIGRWREGSIRTFLDEPPKSRGEDAALGATS